MSESARRVPRLLSLREVANATGMPRSTWYEIVARGEIPFVRVGKAGKRVREDDLLAWIESRREVAS